MPKVKRKRVASNQRNQQKKVKILLETIFNVEIFLKLLMLADYLIKNFNLWCKENIRQI